ncbi:MAG TPA: hypothetical protein VNX01_01025 [Bacteroidia bacterium]|jgi:hypothetical protein|nr:hypothetical protein [Bacteroidia bacterium]
MKAIFIYISLLIGLFVPSKNSSELISKKIVVLDSAKVSAVPTSFGFNSFYKKYIDANGVPIISSDKVPDAALFQARKVVIQMLSDLKISGVIEMLAKNKIRIAVMSKDELTTNIPEHSDLNNTFPETNWDTRARGLGATLARPATSCAEENILCYTIDKYKNEDILIHEFAHTIHEFAISYLAPKFDKKLEKIYKNAKAKGLWKNTYAISNFKEYWAEGVQDWYNLNDEAIPTNGIHNEINTREELKNYDIALYNLINIYFKIDDTKISCHSAN